MSGFIVKSAPAFEGVTLKLLPLPLVGVCPAFFPYAVANCPPALLTALPLDNLAAANCKFLPDSILAAFAAAVLQKMPYPR